MLILFQANRANTIMKREKAKHYRKDENTLQDSRKAGDLKESKMSVRITVPQPAPNRIAAIKTITKPTFIFFTTYMLL